MASVQSSHRERYASNDLDEAPIKHIVSEGEKLIKDLSKKQLDTYLTFSKQKSNERVFTKPVIYETACQKVRGEKPLREFSRIVGDNEVRGCVEIQENRNLEKSGRNYVEEALSVKPNSLETKLLKFALANKNQREAPKPFIPPNHPINHLKTLESQLLADPIALSKKYRRLRKKNLLEDYKETQTAAQKPSSSQWDVVSHSKIEPKRRKVYTCTQETLYTISQGKIVKLSDLKTNNEINLNTIKFAPLADSEIQKMDKFSNYSRGEPTNELYFKNMSNKITEEVLTKIINLACEESGLSGTLLSCKVLTGRMKGQAFASFTTTEAATTVLEAVNATNIAGRPIIIQYRIKKTS